MTCLRPIAALAAGLTLTRLAGCQTEGGLGVTMSDLRDSVVGVFKPGAVDDVKADIKEPIQTISAHQRSLREHVQLTHRELEALTRTGENDLDGQYAVFTQALEDVHEQAGVTTQLRGEAITAADTYKAQCMDTLTKKVTNPGLRKVAQRNLDQLMADITDAVSQNGQYDVDLNPLLNDLDQQAATLKQDLSAESVGRVRDELTELTAEVQSVLDALDQQVVALDKLIEQVDMVDASTSTLGL